MSIIGDILFHGNDLSRALRYQLEQLPSAVNGLAEQTLISKTDAEIIEIISRDYHVEPLCVDYENAEAKVEEGMAELRDTFRYHLPNGPMKVQGIKASKAIPFSGDPELWKLRPNSYTMNPPRGEVRGNTLIVGITVPENQTDDAKRHIDSTIEQLPTYIDAQKRQIEEFNKQLADEIPKLVQQRRNRLGAAADLLSKLKS